MTGTVLERIESDVYDYLMGLEAYPNPSEYVIEEISYTRRVLKDVKEWQYTYEYEE